MQRTGILLKEIFPKLGLGNFGLLDIILSIPTLMGSFPIGIHFGMFLVQVEALGSKEQLDYWRPKARSLEVIGCYAQSELAHGSDV